MKIVQSFWSKPLYEPKRSPVAVPAEDGADPPAEPWKDRKFFCMAWTYSCLQLLKFHGQVELVTDPYGGRARIVRRLS